ncbi:MAG: LysR substrate-binding domain-containing protein [Pseudomonadota bacterium]
MDLSDLKKFEAVARLGSMNRAAATLNTVQSNMTARIRKLEDELGVPLFVRSAQGVDLTPAGERLLPYAKRLANLSQEAARAVRDDGKPAGPLVLGSLETTAALRLSPLIAGFADRYPDVDLSLQTGTSCELVERVLQNAIEGAFVCGPVDHPSLSEDVFYTEELVLLTPPNVTSLEAAFAGDETRIIVLRLGCSYRLILEGMLARRGIVNVRAMEFGTLETIVACVSAGLGITLLPKAMIGPVWQDGRVALHALPPAESRVNTVFIRRRDSHQSASLSAFLDHARLPDSKAAE